MYTPTRNQNSIRTRLVGAEPAAIGKEAVEGQEGARRPVVAMEGQMTGERRLMVASSVPSCSDRLSCSDAQTSKTASLQQIQLNPREAACKRMT